MAQATGAVRVGTSGWSYEDWNGRFYPASKPSRFDDLGWYSKYFDCVEVNSTFYRQPVARFVSSWLRRTPPGFEFAFKLYQRFTHQREAPWTSEEGDAYRRGVAPAAEAGRLGAILVQFPWSFRADDDALRWMDAIRRDFGDLPLVAEVRHVSWTSDEALGYIRSAGYGFANIDQPASRGGVPPMTLVTSPVAYVRLHGRNRAAWFDPKAGRDAKYDYLYDEAELEEWIGRIREIARSAEKTYVFTNNHYRGQAPANALQILSKLEGGPVAVPPPLVETYPFLDTIAVEEGPPSGMLF